MVTLLRRGLLVVVAALVITAVLGGLARMDVPVAWGPRTAFAHGPLLVLGAFGTVIGLERAVALGRAWALAAPAPGAAPAVAMRAGPARAPWPPRGPRNNATDTPCRRWRRRAG